MTYVVSVEDHAREFRFLVPARTRQAAVRRARVHFQAKHGEQPQYVAIVGQHPGQAPILLSVWTRRRQR
jgi:hypothetical protein